MILWLAAVCLPWFDRTTVEDVLACCNAPYIPPSEEFTSEVNIRKNWHLNPLKM